MKYLVWIKEKGKQWETTGEGPFGKATAERIAKEIRHDFGIPTRVLPSDQDLTWFVQPLGDK